MKPINRDVLRQALREADKSLNKNEKSQSIKDAIRLVNEIRNHGQLVHILKSKQGDRYRGILEKLYQLEDVKIDDSTLTDKAKRMEAMTSKVDNQLKKTKPTKRVTFAESDEIIEEKSKAKLDTKSSQQEKATVPASGRKRPTHNERIANFRRRTEKYRGPRSNQGEERPKSRQEKLDETKSKTENFKMAREDRQSQNLRQERVLEEAHLEEAHDEFFTLLTSQVEGRHERLKENLNNYFDELDRIKNKKANVSTRGQMRDARDDEDVRKVLNIKARCDQEITDLDSDIQDLNNYKIQYLSDPAVKDDRSTQESGQLRALLGKLCEDREHFRKQITDEVSNALSQAIINIAKSNLSHLKSITNKGIVLSKRLSSDTSDTLDTLEQLVGVSNLDEGGQLSKAMWQLSQYDFGRRREYFNEIDYNRVFALLSRYRYDCSQILLNCQKKIRENTAEFIKKKNANYKIILDQSIATSTNKPMSETLKVCISIVDAWMKENQKIDKYISDIMGGESTFFTASDQYDPDILELLRERLEQFLQESEAGFNDVFSHFDDVSDAESSDGYDTDDSDLSEYRDKLEVFRGEFDHKLKSSISQREGIISFIDEHSCRDLIENINSGYIERLKDSIVKDNDRRSGFNSLLQCRAFLEELVVLEVNQQIQPTIHDQEQYNILIERLSDEIPLLQSIIDKKCFSDETTQDLKDTLVKYREKLAHYKNIHDNPEINGDIRDDLEIKGYKAKSLLAQRILIGLGALMVLAGLALQLLGSAALLATGVGSIGIPITIGLGASMIATGAGLMAYDSIKYPQKESASEKFELYHDEHRRESSDPDTSQQSHERSLTREALSSLNQTKDSSRSTSMDSNETVKARHDGDTHPGSGRS